MHAVGVHADNRKAVVFCEGELGKRAGKIANGLVRTSHYFDICAVIDSHWHGLTADATVEGGQPIPVYGTLAEVMQAHKGISWFIYGKLPSQEFIPDKERIYIRDALSRQLHVVSGLFHFLSDDEEFKSFAADGLIFDLKKPPPLTEQPLFSGAVENVGASRVLITGTDCDQGKHTTTYCLYQALKESGVSCAMVATSETGILQGVSYGLCPDAWSLHSAAGGIEQLIIKCWEDQRPDIILVEGLASASHPGLMTGMAVMKGCRPDAIIMQDSPGRKARASFPEFAKPDIRYEIALTRKLTNSEPIAITLTPEGMNLSEFSSFQEDLREEYDIPVVDPLQAGMGDLVDSVRQLL
ncbi:DUF1611 domain-containing protein [Parendozoicomonas haliclonae]|uniref:DUF1611 domain-containing protein n=1 Tax=Parendozoicomonas haliclonae TaxID=1960125 RepID=A0A1X7AKV7_9GAMM|nr:DUF1611 domain-containing protein [Parendozoicomonas haliclonae]SMA44827.1 hypothetical protein EHSB41UT_01806 [Parendozoicomonas haliclonae]